MGEGPRSSLPKGPQVLPNPANCVVRRALSDYVAVMTSLLLDAVRRHTEGHAETAGMAGSPIPGLYTVRTAVPGELVHAVSCPLVCLVLQGRKAVTMGSQTFAFAAGESLLITADVPTVSQVTGASTAAPYFSLVLELDPVVVAELSLEVRAGMPVVGGPVRVEPTDAEVSEAALRLLRLVDHRQVDPVLRALRVRELHYWLLAGGHGAAIRRLGPVDSHARRVGRAVAVLRADFAQPLPVERLAATAGMSASSFHRHFLAVTSLSPLQFQKHLRLIEARRLMIAEGASASLAAFTTGYESVPQFTREYGRMFGLPPVRDVERARAAA